MALHYQVYASFSITKGKPQLIRISISTTHAACTSIPFYPYEKTCLTISRIFHTLKEAQSYTAYLHGVYPDNPAPPPVLDSGQKDFFFGGFKMKISNIQTLRNFLYGNSGFAERTVNNVIKALGYPLQGSGDTFRELSTQFENCAEHGADIGISGFIYYSETLPFFRKNRRDIVNHMEQTAAEIGTDIISMVQNFGVFRNSDKPTPSEVGRALWDSGKSYDELTSLYNVFAWYALEEVSRTWYRYLEDNPGYRAELAA